MNPTRLRGALAARLRAHRRVPLMLQQVEELHRSVGALDARLDALSARLDDVTANAGQEARRLDDLVAVVEEARRRAGLADDAIARLVDGAGRAEGERAELAAGLEESRRLSLRIGQLTDLVFAELATSGSAARG